MFRVAGFTFDLSGWFFGLIGKVFDIILSMLPEGPAAALSDLNHMMGPLAKYLAYLAGLDLIFVAVITAYTVRFLIRRLPFIG